MKLTARNFSRLVFFFAAIAVSFVYQNCGVQRPQVENQSYAAIGYSHTGEEISCSACHETDRPNTSAGFLALDLNRPFDYTTHGSGFDCLTCHSGMEKGSRSRADWANGYFKHTATLSNCTTCHNSQRPGNSVADLAITGGFDHVSAGQGECFGCHAASLNTAMSSMADWGGAIPVPAVLRWNSAHDITVPTQVPQFSNTTILSVTPQSQTHHMSMSHNSKQVPAAVLNQCNLCHQSSNYADGLFHANIGSQPQLCSDCHNREVMPDGFVGPINSSRNPASASMRHEAVAWTKNSSGAYSPSGTQLLTADCAVCHKASTGTTGAGLNGWMGAAYHSSLASAGLSQPSSCLDCHANSRPAGSITSGLTAFDHSVDAKGLGDCINCHTSAGGSWNTGKFHQPGLSAPTSCNTCHASQRPNGTTIVAANGSSYNFLSYNAAKTPFDTSSAQNAGGYHGGARDCSVCHKVSQYTTMANWSGGLFHTSGNNAGITSCSECHESQRPSGNIAASASNGLAASFSHASNGQGDCIGCHAATTSRGVYLNFQTANSTSWGDTDWRGGKTYDAVGLMGPDPAAAPTTVNALRLNYSDKANFVVASLTAVKLTVKDQMKHSSKQIPANYWQGGVVGSTLDTTKCNLCHAGLNSTPAKYAPGRFHTAYGGTVPTTGLTSCKECHVNTIPTDVVYNTSDSGTQKLRPMDHSALLSGGSSAVNTVDCAGCHIASQAGGSFSGGAFHSKIGTQSAQSCTVCHATTSPKSGFVDAARNVATSVASLGSLSFSHSSAFASGDCMLCHSMTNSQITGKPAATTSWSGGLFHKFKTPTSITSCSDCHTSKPSAKPTVSANSGQHMNHTSSTVGANCYQCHKTDLVAAATPTAASWSKATIFHVAGSNMTKAGATINTCQECHGLTNGGGAVAGSKNDLPAGLTTTTSLSSYPSTNATSKSLYDQVLHTDVNVAGVDCNKCHSNVANFGMAGTRWKGAKFHINVPNLNASTSCLKCHTNILTYIRANGGIANGQDHTTAGIGTLDCKSCHTYPGTGNAASTTSPANWKGASGGAIPAKVVMLGPTGTSLASVTVAHPAMGTNVTCASCHGASITNKIIGMDHAYLTTGMKCAHCHDSRQQNVAANAKNFTTIGAHRGYSDPGVKSCEDCHSKRYPTKSTTVPANWNTGGSW